MSKKAGKTHMGKDERDIFQSYSVYSIPKAEPFKLWVFGGAGKERIDEIIDPELTIDRAL